MPNRRYGANKYGTSSKYGASSGITKKLGFALEFDWDGNRALGKVNEGGRLLSWSERRGREFIFNSGGDGFQPVDVGEISFILKNTDRRFDPYYVSGELFTALQGNPLCRFRILDESTGTLHYDFLGYVTDIKPIYGTVDKVEITVADGVRNLKDVTISSSSVTSSPQYDTQISAALTAANYLDGTSVDATLSDTMTYHWFSGNSAFSEIMSLVNAVFGLFFVAKDGTATYKSRISSDVSVMDLTEADIDAQYGIKAPSPRDVVKNLVRVYARARVSQAGIELWRLTDVPQLAATSTGNPIWATYNYNGEVVPATSVTEPAATTDYTAFQNADGTGTDYTANISWARTGFATSSKLIPTNSGAAAYLTLMKLRGTAIVSNNYTYAESEDTASQAIYGVKPLTIKSDWLQSLNAATEIADLLIDRFSVLRFFPRVKIKRSAIAKQLTPDLFDLVSINFASKEVTGEMRVGYIERSWNVNEPNVIDTIMYFEPNLTVSASGVWIFPVTLPATLG